MFLDPAADSLQLITDASGSLCIGAYFIGAWFQGDWQPHQHLPLHSIQWQELFAIVAASTWGHHWSGLCIHFHCDNLPIVQAWARQSAKHPDLMQLLRTLFLVAAQHSYTIRLSHLPGRQKNIADALSQIHLHLFFTAAPQADSQPTHHLTKICIYCNHLSHRCQALPGFLPRRQADLSPCTKESITLFAAQSMNPRTYVAAVSFLHHSWVQESCFQEPVAKTCHPKCPTPPGARAHSPQAHM